MTLFPATAESGKPLLKEPWHTTSKQQETVLKSVFLCLEFLFKLFQVFKWILKFLVGHMGATWRRPLAGSWLLNPEIITQKPLLVKSLLGLLALASYWLTLTSEFNLFLFICVL